MDLNVTEILGYGVIGLGFLLALLAYRLLAKEQDTKEPRRQIILSIYVFMIFSVVLCIVGFSSEYFGDAAAKAELDKKIVDLTAERDKGETQAKDLEAKIVDLEKQIATAKAVAEAMLDQKEGKVQKLRNLDPNDPDYATVVRGIAEDLESIDRTLVGLTDTPD